MAAVAQRRAVFFFLFPRGMMADMQLSNFRRSKLCVLEREACVGAEWWNPVVRPCRGPRGSWSDHKRSSCIPMRSCSALNFFTARLWRGLKLSYSWNFKTTDRVWIGTASYIRYTHTPLPALYWWLRSWDSTNLYNQSKRKGKRKKKKQRATTREPLLLCPEMLR